MTATKSFTITDSNFGTVPTAYTPVWCYQGGNTDDEPPEAGTLSVGTVTGGDATLTLTPSATASVRTYYFKVTSGDVSSNVITYNITKADYSFPLDKTVGVKINQSSAPAGTLTAADFFASAPADAEITAISQVTAGGVVSTIPTLNAGTLSWTAVDSLTSLAAADSVYSVTIASTNYNNITAALTFDAVEKTPADITADVADKTYDGAAVSVTPASATEGLAYTCLWEKNTGTAGNPVWSALSPNEAPSDAGSYRVKVTGESETHLGTVTDAFTIAPKALTVNPKALSITKGAALPTFELAYSGIVGNKTLTPSVTAAFTCYSTGTTPVDTSTAAGSYTITWTNKDATSFSDGTGKIANYTITKTAAGTLTISNPSYGDDGGAAAPSANVVIDGKPENIGTVDTKTNTDGSKDTTVKLESGKLGAKLSEAAAGAEVKVTIPETTGAASAQLVVKNIDDMAKKDIELTVSCGDVTYTVPTAAIDTAAIMNELGASDATQVPVSVTIARVDTAGASAVRSNVEKAGEELVGAPIEFGVTATYGGKTVEVTRFDSFVQRAVEITSAQAERITTAVVEEADGSLRHVPTYVFQSGGKWFSKINSRTNSVYAFIYNSATFADASGKWYQAAVEEMASRKILNGKSETEYAGGDSITRAEFAAILVRALGLPADGSCSFSDVKAGDWYFGAVETAVEYGLVNGYSDNSFKPNASITRQEAMAMIQRAAKLAEYAGADGSLESFSDASNVASWAQSAAQFNVGSGLIKGNSGELNPTDNITRAESATVILRLLQKAGLVDVRTNA